MVDLDREHPAYDFKTHKGYITDVHAAALTSYGPCPQHRMRFVNVRRAAGLEPELSGWSEAPDGSEKNEDSVADADTCAARGFRVTRVESSTTRGESA
jgi:ribonuclease HII